MGFIEWVFFVSGIVFWLIAGFIAYGLWQFHKDNPRSEIKYSHIVNENK